MILACPSQPEQHDSWTRRRGEAENLAEIEVEGYHDPPRLPGASEDFPIWQTGEPGIANMGGVVTFGSQPVRHRRRQVHIQQEPHPRGSDRKNFLAGQPGGIGQGLANILFLEVRIVGQDLLPGHTPSATRETTSPTVIRSPRIQARPPIFPGSKVIRSNAFSTSASFCAISGISMSFAGGM
jgi:hypothetical protein